MSYQKQNFVDGSVLTAEHLNLMDTAISELYSIIGSAVTIDYVSLPAANWVGSGYRYSQVVDIPGVTENSQVDLTPSVDQLVIFYEKDLTFVTENDGGKLTVYAIGQKPTNDYTIQVTITEVTITEVNM